MARSKKAKTQITFSVEAFCATRNLLRQTLALPSGPFGYAPRVRAAINEYSELLDAFFAFLPGAQVQAAKKLVLVEGHSYDIKNYLAMADYRLATADLLI